MYLINKRHTSAAMLTLNQSFKAWNFSLSIIPSTHFKTVSFPEFCCGVCLRMVNSLNCPFCRLNWTYFAVDTIWKLECNFFNVL